MGTGNYPPPPPRPGDFQTNPGYRPDPDLEPATAGDVQTLRRWVTVAGVWAVAASLIALIALFGGGDGDSGDDRGGVDSAQIADLAKQIDAARSESKEALQTAEEANETLAAMESETDTGEGPAALEEAQRAAEDATAAVEDLADQVDELEQRIELLEEEASPLGATESTSPGSDDRFRE